MTFRQRGFTMIELLLVIAIIGVLAALAYPQFIQYMFKVRRTDGKALVMEIMARQERYYGDKNTYTTDLDDLGYTLNADGEVVSEEGYYEVGATACTGATIATCVELSAQPQGPQAADAACKILSLNSLGVKAVSGTDSVRDCW